MIVSYKNIKFFDDPKHDSNLTLNFATSFRFTGVSKKESNNRRFEILQNGRLYTRARHLPRSPEY